MTSSDPAAIATQLNAIVTSAAQPWPVFTDPTKVAAFDAIQSALAAEGDATLWQDFATVDLARIQAIQQSYAAAHPGMPVDEQAAWASVMAFIETAFATRNELIAFLTGIEQVLTAQVSWCTTTLAAVSTLVAAGESVYFQVGDDDRTIWDMLLSPLQAIPTVGGPVNTIAVGIVTLSTSGPGMAPNPALQAIQGTTAQMQVQLAQDLQTIVTQIATYRAAACADYTRLNAMHALLVVADPNQWAIDQFDQASLNAIEIAMWQPLMAAGWTIELPWGTGLCKVNDMYFDDFQAQINAPSPKALFYDMLVGPIDGEFYPYHTARIRILGNSGGDYCADNACARLFETLGVPRSDVFNGQNGWALPTDSSYQYNHAPYFSPPMQ